MQTRPHWSFRAMYEILSWLFRFQPIIGRRSSIESTRWSSMVTMVTLPTATPGQPSSSGKANKKKGCLLFVSVYKSTHFIVRIHSRLWVRCPLRLVPGPSHRSKDRQQTTRETVKSLRRLRFAYR